MGMVIYKVRIQLAVQVNGHLGGWALGALTQIDKILHNLAMSPRQSHGNCCIEMPVAEGKKRRHYWSAHWKARGGPNEIETDLER